MRSIPGTLVFLLAAATAQAGDLVPTNPRFGPLRIASHRIDVTVDNQIAMTRVEQVFANDHNVQLEGVYVFPVPKGATIIDFSMTINGKLMRGELLEKKRARSIYESIVRKAKDPGLLEHVGANIFRIRVFPILPRSRQKIELTYVERVSFNRGVCRYVYPLRMPGGKGSTTADRLDLSWTLASRVPIKSVACTPYPADIARRKASEARVTWSGTRVDLSRDIEITYRIGRPEVDIDLVAHRRKGEDGTFLLLITPPTDVPVRPLAKDMTFVFDTSGSMEGERIEQARAALRFCLSKLRAEDRFNVLAFSGEVRAFAGIHVLASKDAKERALRFVDSLDATGGTNIHEALQTALKHRAEGARPHLVLFLTDGEPTVGVTEPKAIVRDANQRNVRLFAFGVGKGTNRAFLDELADSTRAVSEHVEADENIEVKVSRLQEKIASPLITGLALDWGEAEVSAVYPKEPGDLYLGTQLLVSGRFRKAGMFQVSLKGRMGDKEFALTRNVEFPANRPESKAVPYLWAMRKIAAIQDEIHRQGENPESIAQVIELSRKYRIATRYTSFLVLETEQDYDRRGIDRRGAAYKPPMKTAKGPARPGKAVYRRASSADHSETADEEEFQKPKGESLDYTSDKPFKGKGTYDVIGGGGGGGGGGRYGSRQGGRRNLVARGGGTAATEDAVRNALRWLAKNQKADGSWDPGTEDHRAGVTGLTLLSFLGAGYSHLSKDTYDGICFGDVVRRALQWIMAQQDKEGCIGNRDAAKYMYNHAVCALAMSEAYGLTGSNLFKDQAQRAITFLADAQNPGAGWRYSHRSGDNDTSVTGWAMLAFRSAELSGLTFHRRIYDGLRSWVDSVTDAQTGRVGYLSPRISHVFTPGVNEHFEAHPTMTAIGTLTRIWVNRQKCTLVRSGVDVLLRDVPKAGDTSRDYYYWFFASHALFQADGPTGPQWKKWNGPMKDALLKTQRPKTAGDTAYSWDPAGRWCREGGRVYATAINALTLQVYYRYANMLGGK